MRVLSCCVWSVRPSVQKMDNDSYGASNLYSWRRQTCSWRVSVRSDPHRSEPKRAHTCVCGVNTRARTQILRRERASFSTENVTVTAMVHCETTGVVKLAVKRQHGRTYLVKQRRAGGCLRQCCTEEGAREGEQGRGPRPRRGPTVGGPRAKVGLDSRLLCPSPSLRPHNPRHIPSHPTVCAAAYLQYSIFLFVVPSRGVRVVSVERSDTLVRHRQGTLSKASGPPARLSCRSDVGAPSCGSDRCSMVQSCW